MKAVGTVEAIEFEGLRKYVLSREEYQDKLNDEIKNVFQTMYDKKIFPDIMMVPISPPIEVGVFLLTA